MSFEQIIYEKEERIARITINRPKSMNALNIDVLKEINAALKYAESDEEVGAIVLTGAGRAFCAGLDLKSFDTSNVAEHAECPL